MKIAHEYPVWVDEYGTLHLDLCGKRPDKKQMNSVVDFLIGRSEAHTKAEKGESYEHI